MFLKMVIVIAMAVEALASYTPSSNTYALTGLIPFINTTNFLFDGPNYITRASITTPVRVVKPTLEQMMYYNYYAASMYCQYELSALSCETCKKFNKDIDMHKVIINNETDVTAMVTLSKSREEIVITYRGSQNLWNFVLDFTMINACYASENCDIRIHVGFYVSVMSLYHDVVATVGYLLTLQPNYKIVICGHSSGGSMATITTFFLLKLNQFPGKEYELYTYGEFRMGNKGFADYMNSLSITTARATARADIIPHIIPTSILGAKVGDYFVHTLTEYWINGPEEEKFADQSIYEDPTCSNSLGPAYTLLDHFFYFDVNYLVCYANQPQETLALPFILQPIGTIPPLPQPITNFLSGVIGFTSNLIEPVFGR